jgi:ketosteroid isomerase-like protein
MHTLLLLAASLLQASSADVYSAQADLQGLYDEISQASLQFLTEADIDGFHQVMYTPDWVLIDAGGQQHTWSQVREQAVQALNEIHHDPMVQSIQKLTLTPGGATAVVNVTTVHTIVDDQGKYGQKGASHTLTATTPFRDTWVKDGDRWKVKSRQQTGQPKVVVDKPEYEP